MVEKSKVTCLNIVDEYLGASSKLPYLYLTPLAEQGLRSYDCGILSATMKANKIDTFFFPSEALKVFKHNYISREGYFKSMPESVLNTPPKDAFFELFINDKSIECIAIGKDHHLFYISEETFKDDDSYVPNLSTVFDLAERQAHVKELQAQLEVEKEKIVKLDAGKYSPSSFASAMHLHTVRGTAKEKALIDKNIESDKIRIKLSIQVLEEKLETEKKEVEKLETIQQDTQEIIDTGNGIKEFAKDTDDNSGVDQNDINFGLVGEEAASTYDRPDTAHND